VPLIAQNVRILTGVKSQGKKCGKNSQSLRQNSVSQSLSSPASHQIRGTRDTDHQWKATRWIERTADDNFHLSNSASVVDTMHGKIWGHRNTAMGIKGCSGGRCMDSHLLAVPPQGSGVSPMGNFRNFTCKI